MRLPFPIMAGRYRVTSHFCRTRSVAATKAQLAAGRLLVYLGGGAPDVLEDYGYGAGKVDRSVYRADVVARWGVSIATWTHFPPCYVDHLVAFDPREYCPPPWVTGEEPTPTDLELVVDAEGYAAFARDLG